MSGEGAVRQSMRSRRVAGREVHSLLWSFPLLVDRVAMIHIQLDTGPRLLPFVKTL